MRTPRAKRAPKPITVTVVRSVESIDFEAWLTDAIRAILDAAEEKARKTHMSDLESAQASETK